MRVPAGVLESIQQHFRAPPAAVLEAWDPLKLLDGTPFDKTDVYSSANIGMVNQLLQQPAALHAAVSALDIYASVLLWRACHHMADPLGSCVASLLVTKLSNSSTLQPEMHWLAVVLSSEGFLSLYESRCKSPIELLHYQCIA